MMLHELRHVGLGAQALPGCRKLFVKTTDRAYAARVIDRYRELCRLPSGQRLVTLLEQRIPNVAQQDVEASVASFSASYGLAGADDERRRLLHDNRTFRRIVICRDGSANGLRAAPADAYGGTAREEGRGTGTRIVGYDPELMHHGPHPWLRDIPPAIALGHELIHALRYAMGVMAAGIVEEFETIGIGGHQGPQGITENDLRREWSRVMSTRLPQRDNV